MILLNRPPVPEREIPKPRRDAMRAMLVHQIADRRSIVRGGSAWRARRRLLIATSLVVLLLGGVLLWPLPANRAFASWTPAPHRLDDATASQIAEQCIADIRGRPPAPGSSGAVASHSWRATLVDKRGDAAAALVLAPPNQVGRCMFLGLGFEGVFAASGGMAVDHYAQRGQRTITVERTFGSENAHRADGAYAGTHGQAGPDVARVVVVLDDGTKVQASVGDGWYLAWWPNTVRRSILWSSVDWRWPEVVKAYDSSGRLLQQLRPQ